MTLSGISASLHRFMAAHTTGVRRGESGMSVDDSIALTRSGYEKIERELDRLRTVDRPSAADRIRESKQFGEVSENAEYENARNELSLIEGRVQELRAILQNSHVLQDDEIPTDHVGIGSIVKVMDLELDEEWEFTLVHPVEADPNNDRVSDESPVGRNLLGKKAGDEVDIAVPDGKIRYRIDSIRK
jgi:transcription elongation factor GreA